MQESRAPTPRPPGPTPTQTATAPLTASLGLTVTCLVCAGEPCPHAPPPGAHTYTDSDCTADRLFGALCSYHCDVGFIFIQPHGDTQFTVECVLFADVGGSHLAWDGVPQRCISKSLSLYLYTVHGSSKSNACMMVKSGVQPKRGGNQVKIIYLTSC